jgi:hypothetical protein
MLSLEIKKGSFGEFGLDNQENNVLIVKDNGVGLP